MKVSYEKITHKSKLDLSFVLLIIFASAISALGFKMNSPTVIIGAMVLSPLLHSVLGLATSTVRKDLNSFIESLSTLTVAILLAIGVSLVFNMVFHTNSQSEITTRLSTLPLDYFMVAFISGLAGTFAYFWPDISEAIAGVAIAVALIPPMVMVGIGVVNNNLQLSLDSLVIVALNILGIYLGSIVMFAFLNWWARK
ncbi:MAG: DUF389 domain-containing protein [Candidatus Dojkabacteria bacterium]